MSSMIDKEANTQKDALDPAMFEKIEREAMSKALKLAGNSSIMTGVIAGVFSYSTHLVMGLPPALLVTAVFLTIMTHRWQQARVGQRIVDSESGRKRTAFQMDLNQHALSALFTWYGFCLYPSLPMAVQTCYLGICIGSIAVGANFMPFIGSSFGIVLVLRAITLTWALHDMPWMSLAAVVYLGLMYRSGMAHVKSTRASIFHRLKAERAIEELAQRNKEIECISNARADLVAHVTHEIRSPLSGILNAIQLLDEQPNTPDRPALVANARNAGEHLMLVIGDILDNAKMNQQGDLDITHSSTRIEDILDLCSSIVRLRAIDKGLDFRVELTGSKGELVMADSRRISQILLNLLSNAIKYTEEGGVIRLQVHQTQVEPGVLTTYFQVQDTGTGIDAGVQKEIFEEYNTVRTKTGKQRYGSGLGLFISQQIARAMGAEIELQSAIGVGSTFTFCMDLELADSTYQQPEQVPQAPLENACGCAPNPRALVVDDHDINRNVSARTLIMLGYVVETAVSGEDALRQHEQAPFDLVLMDYRMPGMSGSHAARLLREHDERTNRPCKMVIIATTADTTADYGAMDGQKNVNGYLIKPFTRQEMISAVKRLTPSKTQGDEGSVQQLSEID